MRFLSLRNLRFRLVLLICIAIAPAFLVAGYNIFHQYRSASASVQQQALRLMRTAEGDYLQLIATSRQFLYLLSHLPAIEEQDAQGCNQLLRKLKPHYPQFTNIAVINSLGERFASAVGLTDKGTVSGRSWYQRALKRRDFAIGDYQVGALSDKPSIGIAYPIYNQHDSLKTVLFAGIDLAWLQKVASSLQLPNGWELSLIDENGIILTRLPDGDKWVGQRAADGILRKVIPWRKGEGTVRAVGPDGQERIYSFVGLNTFQQEGGGLYLVVGVPLSAIYAELRGNILFYLISFALMVALALAVTGLGSHFFIMRNVDTLISATKELCAGNFKARTGLRYSGGEVGELARAFDVLAQSLEVQETQRRKSRDALRRSEHRFRMIFDSVTESILLIDPVSSAVLDANRSACEVLGYAREELIGLDVFKLISGEPPYTAESAMELLDQVGKSGSLAREWQFRGRTGELFQVELNLTKASIDGQELVLATSRDISQRKEAEFALRESESRYRAFIANSSEGIFRLEMDRPVDITLPTEELLEELYSSAFLAECNDEMARICGEVKADEIVGARLSRLLPSSDSRNFAYIRSFIASGYRLVEAESYRMDALGRERCLMSSLIGRVENGHLIRAWGVLREITRQKQAEDNLKNLYQFNQEIISSAANGIVVIDTELRYVLWNRFMEDLTGMAADDVLGKNVLELFPQFRENGTDALIKRAMQGESCRSGDILFHVPRTGMKAWILSNYGPHFNTRGEIIGVIGIVMDITEGKSERKQAEETRLKLEGQLRQAQKMEAIGTLAGGIAHDFNNILTPIIGYCELSLKEIQKNSGLHKKIEQVLRSSLRAKDLVSQILAFARKSEQESKPVQISLIVTEASNFLRSSLPSTIVIQRRIDADAAVAKVLADPTRIHQILINLGANAAHAMGEKGGTLGITLSRFNIVSGNKSQYSDLSAGAYLKLTISDTGHGIDEELQQRIFEPYFTTKSPSEGTGLGLAVVYGIVKGLGGAIIVSSKPGEGAVFDIFLPIAEQPAESVIEESQGLAVGSGHILLVDDEMAVADLQKEMLEHLGYKAIAKYNSLEALKVFSEKPYSFDLILTDQTMPHMTGIELARQALKIRRDIPIVLCTGFSEGIDELTARNEGISAVLAKPLLLHETAEAIHKVLAKE